MKNKVKKSILKARYVDLELQEVKDVYTTCVSEWNSYVARISGENNIKQPDTTCNVKLPEKEASKPKKQQPGVVKHMYREIARKVHPDKTRSNDEDNERLMRQATRAKESGDLISLLDMCDDLGLDTPDLRIGHVKYIEKLIEKKETEITKMKQSDAWIWYHADEAGKEKIKKLLIKALKC